MTTQAPPSGKVLPGEEGIWVLVLGDMIVFGLFFTGYLFYRAEAPILFNRSQALLDVRLGAANTLLLLTSSWLVATGVEAVREGLGRRARELFASALACGVGFLAIKTIEYHREISAGHTLISDRFFMYYFMFTGTHLLHVVIGLVVLGVMSRKAAASTPADARGFETGATFWHMVDLLWIMLFPLLYLVR